MKQLLSNVFDLETMLRYLTDHLDWGIDEALFEDVDDVLYEFDAEDIGIKEDEFAKIVSLKQLRPLTSNQPWGIFFVEFESKKLEITALRRILNSFIPRRNNTEHKTWKQEHLLFICFWGEKSFRTIGFITFENSNEHLPLVRALYCTPKIEEMSHIENFEQRVKGLRWPSNNDNDWLASWSKVFAPIKGLVIRDTVQLTETLAAKAIEIVGILNESFVIENNQGMAHKIYSSFNDALSLILSRNDFTDMYAQTIVYGLFSARCMQSNGLIFDANVAIESVPNTNPFLKALLTECCFPGGNMHFDELEILDLIEILRNTDIESILNDFNRQTGLGKEDPIVYFYELFLDIYEKEQKKRIGVYYTPTPLVNFMVRSVSFLLKNSFSCENGLMDSDVSVLDPATGTGTFLRKIILDIYDEYQGNANIQKANGDWSSYAQSCLLTRIYGFEFKMAPYAVAHMKLAMTLRETGYDFNSDKRLQVYLANTLDLNDGVIPEIENSNAIIKEVRLASLVMNKKINVIIGNPPYRTNSVNKSEWIMRLMDDYKKEPGSDERLQERNPKVVNDDYVKFLRFAHEMVKNRDNAIISFVIPHSIADNITFRGVRWNLLNNFQSIYILDLHGNVMSRESSNYPERDENVFDIQQGVCICTLIRNQSLSHEKPRVFYSDLWGSRTSKYHRLDNASFSDIKWVEIEPVAPYLFFKPKGFSDLATYESGISLAELFPTFLGGVKTHNDDELISSVPFDNKFNQTYEYRPFDIKFINYDLSKVERHRYEVMKHFIGKQNYGLVINRQVVTDNWSHIQVVKNMIDNRLHYSRKGIPVLCPMLIYDDNGRSMPNVDYDLVKLFEDATSMRFIQSITTDSSRFNVLDLFDYCYAMLFRNNYRIKYKAELSVGFPRVPLPINREQFIQLVKHGKELRELHLMERTIENTLEISFIGIGDNIISRPRFHDNRIFINRNQFFSNVREDLWDFCFGGYHGMQKWLKDRSQSTMTADDVNHFILVMNIFDKTESIMADIDLLLDIS